MLEDRDYMREPEYMGFHWKYPMTFILMGINLIVFVFNEICTAYFPNLGSDVGYYCAISAHGIGSGYVWQFLTFQFMHFGRWHFFGNMLGLFFLGRLIEERIGPKRLLFFYLACGVFGGILQVLLGFLFPHTFGSPTVGASAGVFGLLAAWAAFEPYGVTLLFFILPMRNIHLLWLCGIVAVFYILVPAEPGIAHGAHLGGMLAGWYGTKKILMGEWSGFFDRFRPSSRAVALREREGKVKALPGKVEVLEDDVDVILDKISARGMNSLT
ncbi:MAG TPA: rhomboid family intramembrane serine protease, partial [Verrucomicrobiae bacterium]